MKPTRFHDSHKEERPKKPTGARIEFGVDKQYKLIEDRGYKVGKEFPYRRQRLRPFVYRKGSLPPAKDIVEYRTKNQADGFV